MTKTKYIILYQIYDNQGHKIYEPFYILESAKYMLKYSSIKNGLILEIEIELNKQ